jgi:hypothetical protein
MEFNDQHRQREKPVDSNKWKKSLVGENKKDMKKGWNPKGLNRVELRHLLAYQTVEKWDSLFFRPTRKPHYLTYIHAHFIPTHSAAVYCVHIETNQELPTLGIHSLFI